MPSDYKSTTLLPNAKTFPMKANLPELEPRLLRVWAEDRLYEQLLSDAWGTPFTTGGSASAATPVPPSGSAPLAQPGRPPFILHDGPPYANGHLHEGHFLNKVLKDIVVKHALMGGHPSPYIPGWDCHGLPIELAVDKELGPKKRELSKVDIRKACRAHAQKFIDIQRDEFKRLGVFGRWDKPYATMDFAYEAEIVRQLARVVRQGAVYRGKKPVYWCWNDRTALAEAEIEYQDDVGPSIYVAFRAADDLGAVIPALSGKRARFAIWTTTPWSLPGNVAIAVHPDFTYVAYELRGKPTLIAKDLLFSVLAAVAPEDIQGEVKIIAGQELPTAALTHPERVLGYAEGRQLEGLAYQHPFLDRQGEIILGDHVTLEAGTGLVHTAPGHGHEDYEVGQRYRLAVPVPIDDGGVLTEDAGPFAGQFYEKANPKIEALLQEKGLLLNPPGQTYNHSYPHCWRCKKPVILRATAQWFISMETTKLRARALESIKKVKWVPSWGEDRIRGMLEARPDWCISRQRAWGVPIPALYCEGCGEVSLSADVLDHVAEQFEQDGADAWFAKTVEELVPPGTRCPSCGGTAFKKEENILDVWFESGLSQAAVAKKELGWPVDLYLEGSDQHRGWFQSSLLCALAAGETESPFRACLTHGFVVDGQGRKLSKSLGNSIDPQKMIRQYGAEIVRMWVASEDYRDDVRLSDEILQRQTDAYRKLRNTLRFAIGVLEDFDRSKDAVAPAELATLDRYLRSRLHGFVDRALTAYAAYDFHAVIRGALDFVSVELSALHFDVSKDRLYCDEKTGRSRRSAQTVIREVADVLCRILAPIMPFTCEEAFGQLGGEKAASVFAAGLPAVDQAARDAALEEEMGALLAIREDVQGELEALRQSKAIGSSQAARVELWGEPLKVSLRNPVDVLVFLGELFIVSELELRPEAAPPGVHRGPKSGRGLRVSQAAGRKCDRCWNYRKAGTTTSHGFVCDRCVRVLATLGNAVAPS